MYYYPPPVHRRGVFEWTIAIFRPLEAVEYKLYVILVCIHLHFVFVKILCSNVDKITSISIFLPLYKKTAFFRAQHFEDVMMRMQYMHTLVYGVLPWVSVLLLIDVGYYFVDLCESIHIFLVDIIFIQSKFLIDLTNIK